MSNAKKKNKLAGVLAILLSLVLGGGIGALIAVFALGSLDPDLPFPLFMLSLFGLLFLFYLSFFLHIIIHEGGHLIFGLLTGYRFSSFRIGSMMFVKKNGKLQKKRLSLAGTGGQCLMLPPDWTPEGVPYVLYNLGGCIANTVVSVLSFVIWLFVRDNPYASIFFFSMTAVGLLLAVTNGIPLHTGGLDNDGMNALSLGKNLYNLKCMWLQLQINGHLAMGTRLRDMPEEWFFVPEKEHLSYILASTIGIYTCSRAMDEQNFEKAGETAAYLLEHAKLAAVHKGGLQAELLFCELIGANRPEEVSRMFDEPEFRKFLRTTASYPSTLRLLYAYALFHHRNEDEARHHLVHFEKSAKVYPYECEIVGERELLNTAYQRYLKCKEEWAAVPMGTATEETIAEHEIEL